MKNRIRRGRGTQGGNPENEIQRTCIPIRFTPALQSAETLYGPLFNACGRGQLPVCDVKQPTSFRSQKGRSRKDLKSRAYVSGTFYSLNPISYSPSKSPETLFSHVDICHLQIRRNTGLLLFSKINVWTV